MALSTFKQLLDVPTMLPSFLPFNSSSVYSSTPLNKSQNEIRLNRILPGKFGYPIRCSLRRASLDSHPKYEALSYV
ncbi:hypothetical protein K469DRAFT_782244 [Zopfia rhizophila CBS 207.26]|uniref:Uncharacterized protein n=1 Tax=Zopfia rhizophila CBS 207.26 TaxID=1314779 RepID=A0A6A6EQS6_9PEZI|nr:hypothetical protein K469DRAFT_782244 [Zopfia rhizophila CBS 207.26]